MSPAGNWPLWIKASNREEMMYIGRLAAEIVDHELEADLHPFLQSALEWASLRTSRMGLTGYRIKSIAQFTMSLPPDAYVVAEPTSRRLRSMTGDASVVHESLSSVSYASGQSAVTTPNVSVVAGNNTWKRERDIRRTPDYATLLTPNDPSKAHQRLMCLHELKRYDEKHESYLQGIRVIEVQVVFRQMVQQTAEQAQLALWNFPDAKSVYVMCHAGIYFSVFRFSRRKKGRMSGAQNPFGRVILQYRSKAYKILNDDQTEFSSDFKRWWTIMKNIHVGDLVVSAKKSR